MFGIILSAIFSSRDPLGITCMIGILLRVLDILLSEVFIIFGEVGLPFRLAWVIAPAGTRGHLDMSPGIDINHDRLHLAGRRIDEPVFFLEIAFGGFDLQAFPLQHLFAQSPDGAAASPIVRRIQIIPDRIVPAENLAVQGAVRRAGLSVQDGVIHPVRLVICVFNLLAPAARHI